MGDLKQFEQKKGDPPLGFAFVLLPLPLIPTACTQSHSHLARRPAIRDHPQQRARIACRLCRCRSSVCSRLLEGDLPTVACRFSRCRRAGTGRGCRSGRPRHWRGEGPAQARSPMLSGMDRRAVAHGAVLVHPDGFVGGQIDRRDGSPGRCLARRPIGDSRASRISP